MARILIADRSTVFCETLMNELCADHEVLTCTMGDELPEALQTLRPDLLIIDLELYGTDSICLLQTAYMAGIRPRILAMSFQPTDYVERALNELQTDLIMRKPCKVHQVALHALNICRMDAQEAPQTLEYRIEVLLLNLGFYRHPTGYNCVACALRSMTENPFQSITKELYPYVASQCGGNWKSVEHAIRNCIEKAYKRRNEWTWRMYFPGGRDGKVGHLTNAAFLTCLAAHLRKETPKKKQYQKAE